MTNQGCAHSLRIRLSYKNQVYERVLTTDIVLSKRVNFVIVNAKIPHENRNNSMQSY